MKRFSQWLCKVSTGWVALIALAIFVLFTVLVLPGQSADSTAATGESRSPDTSFFYSAADIYSIADAYGEAGRSAYIRARLTFDVVWPIVYTVFLSTAISWLYARAFPEGSPWRLANLVPVLGALFDYLENAATVIIMARYPLTTPVVADVAGYLTLIKWVFVGGSFVVLPMGILFALWRSRQRHYNAAE